MRITLWSSGPQTFVSIRTTGKPVNTHCWASILASELAFLRFPDAADVAGVRITLGELLV